MNNRLQIMNQILLFLPEEAITSSSASLFQRFYNYLNLVQFVKYLYKSASIDDLITLVPAIILIEPSIISSIAVIVLIASPKCAGISNTNAAPQILVMHLIPPSISLID